jgi:hypothetical protein
MDLRSVVMRGLATEIIGTSSITLTNGANAGMHEAGLAVSDMTRTNSSNVTMPATDQDQQLGNTTTNTTAAVVRDSVFAYLDGRILPAFDFIHLYDTTPYMIMNGHVAAKLPCDAQSQTPLRILIGQAPHMIVAGLGLVPELSRPGVTCMYHADLQSAQGDQQGDSGGTAITDIAIMNPTATEVQFPAASTVVIGVNEIMPLEEGGGAETTGAGGEQHQH